MQKKVFLALLLVAAITLSGCSLVVKDPEIDAQRIVLDVNGETVTKAEFLAEVEYQLDYMEQYYAYYGYSFDREANRADVQNQMKEAYIEKVVKDQKLKELGLELTDEKTEQIKAEADATYAEYADLIKSMYLTDTEGMTEEEIAAQTDSLVASLIGYTKEGLESSELSSAREAALKEYAVKDVQVTDEQVKAEYDAKVEEAKTAYTADPIAYGEAVNGGEEVYYAPAGYRYVKQVLVKFLADDNTVITNAKTALTNAQNALGEEPTEEQQAAVTEAQAALDAAKEAAYKNIEEKVQDIYTRAAAGEDFEALIEEFNEDPGMNSEPGKTYGYAICAGYTPFEQAFVDGAMSLANAGDVTEPIKSDSYGYYIIRYQADIPEGAVALETVQQGIHDELLTAAQDEAYEATVQEWANAAKVTAYMDRLAD